MSEIDLTAAVEAAEAANADDSWIDELSDGPEAVSIRQNVLAAITVAVRAAAPVIERAKAAEVEFYRGIADTATRVLATQNQDGQRLRNLFEAGPDA